MESIEAKPKRTNWGGAGRGQGRKRGQTSILAEKMRVQMAKMLHKRFAPIVQAQLDAAEGIQTEEYNKKTGELFYKSPGPDTQAFKNIFEQVAGRATENVKVSSPDGEPLIVKLDS